MASNVVKIAQLLHSCTSKKLTPEVCKQVESLMSLITRTDLQLDKSLTAFENMGYRVGPDELPFIAYVRVYECPTFSMGMFSIPYGASLPLHNHPRMFGFIKSIDGLVHIKSYTLGKRDEDDQSGLLSASVTGDSILDECSKAVGVLSPDENNLHEIRPAGEKRCTFFDVLFPKYNPLEGRNCHFYSVASVLDDNRCLLEDWGQDHRDSYATAEAPYFGEHVNI